MKKIIDPIVKILKTTQGKAITILFFFIMLGGSIGTSTIYNLAEEGCASSPYYDFKQENCMSDTNPHSRISFNTYNTLMPPTTLLRAGLVKVLPIYSAVDVHVNIFATSIDVAYDRTTPSWPRTAFQTIFDLLGVAFLGITAAILATIWEKNIYTKVVTVGIISLSFIPVTLLIVFFTYYNLWQYV